MRLPFKSCGLVMFLLVGETTLKTFWGVNVIHGLQLLATVSGKEQGLQIREGDVGIASQDILDGGPTAGTWYEGKFYLCLTKPAKFLRGKDVSLLRDGLTPAGHAYGRGGARA